MPSKHTQNYQLNQWERSDKVLMEDFNADNAKIDAALKAAEQRAAVLSSGKADKSALDALSKQTEAIAAVIPELVFGSYTGNGAENRTISLGFTPKALYICTNAGVTCYYHSTQLYLHGGLVLPDHPLMCGSLASITIQPGGFHLYHVESRAPDGIYSRPNLSGTTYHYLAVK